MAVCAYWQDLTTTEIDACDRRIAVCVLPVAAIEQHGPHLPLATDALINRGIVAEALRVGSNAATLLALPALDIGHSIEHTNFAGTLSLDAVTVLETWCTIARNVHAAGFDKIVIFNSHGGQKAIVDLAAVRLRQELGMRVARASYFSFGMPSGLFDAEEIRLGIHGGEVETSLMLALAPELVRSSQLRDFRYRDERRARDDVLSYEKPTGIGWLSEDLNPAGVVGNAARADAARGRRYLEFLGQRLVAVCEAMLE